MAKTKKPKYKVCEKCEHYQKSLRKAKRGGFFFKALVSLIVLHGMFCVTQSYMLAWRDHINVVEAVSTATIAQIIAPVIAYALSKTWENTLEKNKLKFSTPLSYLQENKASEDEAASCQQVNDGEEEVADENGLVFLDEFAKHDQEEVIGNG